MADYLPSPTGGFNPWALATQPTAQPSGINPLIQHLMDQRSARIKGEQDFRNMSASQMSGLAPVLGGAGVASMYEGLAERSGMPGARVDPSFYQQNDPAKIRAQNAQSSAHIGGAIANAGSVGQQLMFRNDGTIAEHSPMQGDVLNNVMAAGRAKSPTSITYSGDITSGSSNKITQEGFHTDPKGNPYKQTTVSETEQSQTQAAKNAANPVNLGQGQGQGQQGGVNAQGASQYQQQQGGNAEQIRRVNEAVQSVSEYGPGAEVVRIGQTFYVLKPDGSPPQVIDPNRLAEIYVQWVSTQPQQSQQSQQ